MADTTRGYPYPAGMDDFDVPGDVQALAEAVDADVAAVETVAGLATSGVASDLAAHEAATTGVHGIVDTSVLVTSARQVIAGTGLTGGGTLGADRTLAVAYGTSAGTAAQGDDSRLSDARTPTSHAATHAAAGSDPVTVAQSQVTGLTSDLAGKVPATRTLTTTAPFTGGGDLSANRTLALAASGVTPIYLGGGYRAITSGTTITADDYVIDVTSGTFSQALPAAATAGAGRRYVVRNSGTGAVTVTGPASSVVIGGLGQIDVVSTGSAWVVLDGMYSTSAVGLASYRWNAASAAWRLIAYDTGVRDVSDLLVNGWAVAGTDPYFTAQRIKDFVLVRARLTAAAYTAETFATLPSGFTASGTARGLAVQDGASSSSPTWRAGIVSTGTCQIYAATSAAVAINWTLPAAPALPSSLPGTQATAPF